MSDTTEAPQNTQLEAFLAAGTPEPSPPAPSQPEAPKPEPKSDQPKPQAQTSPPVPAAPEAEDDHDDGSGTVPLSAFRKAREDWKVRAAAAEARAAELARQVDAMRQGPVPQAQPHDAPQPIGPPPNPATDPAGYHAWLVDQRNNDNLNHSEALLRMQMGDAAVDEMVAEFKQMGAQNRRLFDDLKLQRHPYLWAYQQVQQQRLLREVGNDPEAYRQKLRAEIEAEYAAKMGQAAPPPSPAAGIPPSLATVRSSAPRGQVFSGPPAIEDIVGKRSGDLFARQR